MRSRSYSNLPSTSISSSMSSSSSLSCSSVFLAELLDISDVWDASNNPGNVGWGPGKCGGADGCYKSIDVLFLGPQISHNEQLFCWDSARSMVLSDTFNPWFESHQKFVFGKLADLTVNQSDKRSQRCYFWLEVIYTRIEKDLSHILVSLSWSFKKTFVHS